MKNGTQGFTLIELLIVIAIIGILAAVLIPNLLGARNRANDAAAQSYVRNVVAGVETQRNPVTGALPNPLPTCPNAAGVSANPASVRECTVAGVTGNADAFTVTATSVNGNQFSYNGREVVAGPPTAP